MSYRIAISFAAVAIGMSFIATDALARGGGGGGKGGGKAVSTGVGGPTIKGAGTGVRAIPRTTGVGGPTGGGGNAGLYTTGVGGPTGGGAAAGARYYAPAFYDSNAACGRYPYPPCKKVLNR